MTTTLSSPSRLGSSAPKPAPGVIAPPSILSKARGMPGPSFGAPNSVPSTCPASTITDPGRSIASHTLRKIGGDRLQQETHVEGQTFRAIVDYAFGSGDRGLTLVGHEDDGQARELRLSHYPNGAGSIWDVTAGHPSNPRSLAEYLGQPLTEDSVRRCLFCHVTDARAVLKGSGPGASDHGIGCEKCHGPGGNHLLAVAAKFPDLAIARPSMASGTPYRQPVRPVP